MANGIEELSEMQVTGPVQGGDMVAKPNEMPVGAAALLNKMQKKSTPGIFKLPTPDKEMPDFMKVAAEGLQEETQMAESDTYNIMAGELLRQGFNPDYIKSLDPIGIHQLYEETFGSSKDAGEMSQVAPDDWRTILKMLESGMTTDQIEEQLAMNEVKDDLHMKAAAVEEYAPEDHQLAYITPDESNILQLIGGSGEINPMTGIQQFPQYGGETGASDEDEKDTAYGGMTPREASGRDQEWTPEGRANVERMAREGEKLGKIIPGGTQQPEDKFVDIKKIIKDDDDDRGKDGGLFSDDPKIVDIYGNILKNIESDIAKQEALKAAGDEDYDADLLSDLMERQMNIAGGKGIGGESIWADPADETKEEDEEAFTKLIRTVGPKLLPFPLNLLTQRGDPIKDIRKPEYEKQSTRIKELLAQYEKGKGQGIIADLMGGKDQYKREGGGLTKEGLIKSLRSIDMGKGASALESMRKYDPETYYSTIGPTQTSGGMEKLSKQAPVDTSGMKPGSTEYKKAAKYNNQIFAAREQVSVGRRGGGRGLDYRQDVASRGGGGGGTSEIIEDVSEVTTTDPRAGAFNVGGTMPYTHDVRTAGVETDVPLGRRFDIDKAGEFRGGTGMSADDAYKYATMGGYSQLEPFQEYLTRRRKHLGEEKPRWFDEEGNVIFSDMETA